jgi:hypothetical protein
VKRAARDTAGRALVLLGTAGIVLDTVLLALDWIAFDDRSNTEVALLAAGIVAVLAGGWALRSARAALMALSTAVLLAALFLSAAAFFEWLRSGYFFAARSRWLLRGALGALLAAAAVLAADRFQRRGAVSLPRT